MERKSFLEIDYRIFVSDIIKQMIQKGIKLDKSEVLFYGLGESQDKEITLYLRDVIEEFIRYDVKIVVYCKTKRYDEFEWNKKISFVFSSDDLLNEREQRKDHRLPFKKQCFNVVVKLSQDSKEDCFIREGLICNNSIKIEL